MYTFNMSLLIKMKKKESVNGTITKESAKEPDIFSRQKLDSFLGVYVSKVQEKVRNTRKTVKRWYILE